MCSPLAAMPQFTLRGVSNDRGVSLVATSDQRYARWIAVSF